MPPAPNNSLNWADLLPVIEKIARQVGLRTNASPRVRDELVTLAVSFVYEKSGHYNPAVGKFEAWCQTVLRNKCVDLIQREAADRRLIEGVGQELMGNTDDLKTNDDESEIPKVDWANYYRTRRMPIDRVLLILDLERCSQFPADTVAGWIQEAGLPKEFPLKNLEAGRKRSRNEAIARELLKVEGCAVTKEAVNTKTAWIRQRLRRAKKDLEDFFGN